LWVWHRRIPEQKHTVSASVARRKASLGALVAAFFW
jgi:hypothetical protein